MSHNTYDDKSILVQVMDCCLTWGQQSITWASFVPYLYHHMVWLGHKKLTHWGLDIMTTILKMHFPHTKYLHLFRFKFYWRLNWQWFSTGPGIGLALNHSYLNQWWLYLLTYQYMHHSAFNEFILKLLYLLNLHQPFWLMFGQQKHILNI